MTIAALIELLLTLFGPLLGELLKKWFEHLLDRAAGQSTLTAAVPPGEEVATATALLERAVTLTPRVFFVRRKILRRIRAAVPAAFAAHEVDPAAGQEILGLVGRAE